MISKKKPLEGIKVVELARVAVGPCTGRILGNWGATVIHVETSRRPDICRTIYPFKDNISGINRGGYFARYNADKYGMALDLGKPKGLQLMKRLIKWSDVFIESNAPGVVTKYGLDYEGVVKIKADIIMLSTCQMGQEGPLAEFKAYGVQSAAMAGFDEVTGYPDGDPVGPFGSYTDVVSPQFLIVAVLAALDYRRRTGKGQYLDHSQLEAGIHFLPTMILEYSTREKIMTRQGNREIYASPHGCYRCRGDDRWCVIAVFSDKEWLSFCTVIGNPGWTREARFATILDRKANEDSLDKLVENWTINFDPWEVMDMMQKAGVPSGVVATGEDLHRDPQLKCRGHFTTVNHTEMGPIPCDNAPFKLSKTPCEIRKAAPCLGEDNEFICKNILGLPDEEFVQLIQEGVLE